MLAVTKELIFENITDIKDNNSLVIVEGKKDKNALNYFGVENIICLKNRPLFEVVESIDAMEAIILTDLDLEGRKLFSKIRHCLQRRGIKINNNLRKNLFRTKLRNIEGLVNYLNNK